jgi:hypothetical protein
VERLTVLLMLRKGETELQEETDSLPDSAGVGVTEAVTDRLSLPVGQGEGDLLPVPLIE